MRDSTSEQLELLPVLPRGDNRRSEREQNKLACYAEPQGGKGRQALNGKVGDVAVAAAEGT